MNTKAWLLYIWNESIIQCCYQHPLIRMANHLAAALSISAFLCLFRVCEGQNKIRTWHSPRVLETWLPKGSMDLLSSTTPSLGEERNRFTAVRKLHIKQPLACRWRTGRRGKEQIMTVWKTSPYISSTCTTHVDCMHIFIPPLYLYVIQWNLSKMVTVLSSHLSETASLIVLSWC